MLQDFKFLEFFIDEILSDQKSEIYCNTYLM